MTTEQPDNDSLLEQTLAHQLDDQPAVEDAGVGALIDFNPEPDGPAIDLSDLDGDSRTNGDPE